MEIPGYPMYSLDEEGKVYSKHTKKYLLQFPVGGYLRVTLTNQHGKKATIIHKLMAALFLPNPKNLPLVRHLDGNPLNNKKSNLAWGTYKDNSADSARHGTVALGEDHGRAVLNTEKVKLVRMMRHSFGWSFGKIARIFGTTKRTIMMVINNITWKHVT